MNANGTVAATRTPLELLREHGHNPSAVLALNERTHHYTSPGSEGFIAYRRAGRFLVQFGGVFAPEEERAPLLRSFRAFAAAQRSRVIAIQLLRPDAESYAESGFVVNQFGASYTVDLDAFSFAGGKFRRTRNRIRRAEKCGVAVTEAAGDDVASHLRQGMADLDRRWIAAKGRGTKELAFLVPEHDGFPDHLRRVFAATDEAGDVVAYASLTPAFGRWQGYLCDTIRRDPDAPPGAMELLTARMIEQVQQEMSARYLHLGLTPFTSLSEDNEIPGATSSVVARTVRFLAEHGESVYPTRSQIDYKLKWRPQIVHPEYVAFEDRVSPTAIWRLLRLADAL